MLSAFTWHKKCYLIINNERGVRKKAIFSKIQSKIKKKLSEITFKFVVEDITYFYLISKTSFHRQYSRSSKQTYFFCKFDITFFKKCFLKISLHFLVDDVKPFHLKCELFLYC